MPTNEVVYTVVRDEGRSVIDEIGVETGFEKKVVYRIRPDDPTSARVDLRESIPAAASARAGIPSSRRKRR